MRQVIIWTNADTIHWRTYAALGGDELIISANACWQQWSFTIIFEIRNLYLPCVMIIVVELRKKSFDDNTWVYFAVKNIKIKHTLARFVLIFIDNARLSR